MVETIKISFANRSCSARRDRVYALIGDWPNVFNWWMAMPIHAGFTRRNIVTANISPVFTFYLRHVISLAKWSSFTKSEHVNFVIAIPEKFTSRILADAAGEAISDTCFAQWRTVSTEHLGWILVAADDKTIGFVSLCKMKFSWIMKSPMIRNVPRYCQCRQCLSVQLDGLPCSLS